MTTAISTGSSPRRACSGQFLASLDPDLSPKWTAPLPEIVALCLGATLHDPVENGRVKEASTC